MGTSLYLEAAGGGHQGEDSMGKTPPAGAYSRRYGVWLSDKHPSNSQYFLLNEFQSFNLTWILKH